MNPSTKKDHSLYLWILQALLIPSIIFLGKSLYSMSDNITRNRALIDTNQEKILNITNERLELLKDRVDQKVEITTREIYKYVGVRLDKLDEKLEKINNEQRSITGDVNAKYIAILEKLSQIQKKVD